ncbi:arylsulfatase B-like [Ptychodera flava]|uniref:arylsulfatase B-like n=1 Tax=Ptychodera flava TaxID=63121 RepID=UPI00396A7126
MACSGEGGEINGHPDEQCEKDFTGNGRAIEIRTENSDHSDGHSQDGSEVTEAVVLLGDDLKVASVKQEEDSKTETRSLSSNRSDGTSIVEEIELTELRDGKAVTSTDGDAAIPGFDGELTEAALKKIRKNAIGCALLTGLIMMIVVLAIVVMVLSVHKPKPPHIVVILAADLGWNDVGWNNPDVSTPVINRLASEGVLFNWTYVQPLCTPTRAALMTGFYPFKIGMQHQMLWNLQRSGLPLHLKLLPEKLQEVGYLTHHVGKWHLGFCNWAYTPTQRGFDTHYGPLTGGKTHEEKLSSDMCGRTATGHDFWDGSGVVQDNATFLTYMLVERIVKILSEHYSTYPLYLQFSMDIPGKIIEVPPKYENAYRGYTLDERTRKYLGILALMDEAVGNITQALKTYGLWDDTLLIFMGDNGALASSAGSNWPLRGSVGTLFEGAVRVPSFVAGRFLKVEGHVSNELVHVVDWHRTILSLAGIRADPNLDGIDMWESISEGKSSPRTEIVYNIEDDNFTSSAAIRVGDYKLITGNPDLLYPCRLSNESDGWYELSDIPFEPFRGDALSTTTPPTDVVYLFNIQDDPEERNNTADLYPEIVDKLQQRLDEHRKGIVPIIDTTRDLAGHPRRFGGEWSPGWC